MAIDASIYGQQAPSSVNPLGTLGALLDLRAQQEQLGGLREQRAAIADERRQRTELSRQEAERSARLQALFASNPQPTRADILKADGSENGIKIADAIDAMQDRELARYKNQRDVLLRSVAGIGALPEPLRQPAHQAFRQEFVTRGWARPEDIPEDFDPAFAEAAQRQLLSPDKAYDVAHPKPVELNENTILVDPITGKTIVAGPAKVEKPAAAGSFEDYLRRVAESSGKTIGQLSPADVRRAKAEYEAAGRAPEATQLVQIMGPQGTPIWVRESDAVGKPAAQAARAVTGQERQALAFFNRAKEAHETIATLEEAIGKMSLAGQARLQMAPNWLQSPENQAYRQAQRAFTEARLRKESGAAIPTHEYENDAKTYFAVPGDTPAIIEQKRQARETLLDGLAFTAGKAYDEFYGEPRPRRGQPAAAPKTTTPASPAKPSGPKARAGEHVEEWVRDPKTGRLVKK